MKTNSLKSNSLKSKTVRVRNLESITLESNKVSGFHLKFSLSPYFEFRVQNRNLDSNSPLLRSEDNRVSTSLRYSPDSGSLLPLMVGFLLISLFTYMIAIDVFSLRYTKVNLERLGEDLVSEVVREISYQEYYFGQIYNGNQQRNTDSASRVFIPITCPEVLTKLYNLARNLPRNTRLLSADCAMNQLRLSITKRVDLPYFPRSLVNFQPDVIAYVGGGLQRIPSN